jgi:hypothetical protein
VSTDRPYPGTPASRRRRLAGGALVLALAALGSGCAAAHIKPWDRDLLSEKNMQFEPCPMISAIDQHVYFSKEASMGGADVGGGGCGCN